MLSYITRRILLAIPVLIGIVVVVFFLIRAIPGDPCTSLLGERATEEACERFNEANGLNEPIFVQLGIYMGNVARSASSPPADTTPSPTRQRWRWRMSASRCRCSGWA